jgi:hypothetical protein
MGRHGPCRAARTDQVASLTETARQLADAVGELRAANAKLQEVDSTVAATIPISQVEPTQQRHPITLGVAVVS